MDGHVLAASGDAMFAGADPRGVDGALVSIMRHGVPAGLAAGLVVPIVQDVTGHVTTARNAATPGSKRTSPSPAPRTEDEASEPSRATVRRRHGLRIYRLASVRTRSAAELGRWSHARVTSGGVIDGMTDQRMTDNRRSKTDDRSPLGARGRSSRLSSAIRHRSPGVPCPCAQDWTPSSLTG